MIRNIDFIKNKIEVSKLVADYLIYKCNLPLLGHKDNKFYFAKTLEVKEALESMPLILKLCNLF